MKIIPPQSADTKDAAAPKTAEAGRPGILSEHVGTETILLVEDERTLRELLTFALERYGYTILVAVDGENAIEIADAHHAPIHLVLSDVVMPKMDGCTLCKNLRRWYPAIGVLLMSGFSDGEALAMALEDDMTFFIRKPFGISEMAAAVRSALDSRPSRASGSVPRQV